MSTQYTHDTQALENVQKLEFRAMGSHILAAIRSDDPAATALLAQVPMWFEEWEQTLSRFRESSELTLLNLGNAQGSPMPVSARLWEVLQLALKAAAMTDGLVTPTLLNALEAAGYHSSFDLLGAEDRRGETESENTGHSAGVSQVTKQAELAMTWRDIVMYPHERSVKLPRGMRLDLGGVAKGWAADEAVSRLAKYGPALVNAGGDIAVKSARGDGFSWPVGVDAPELPAFAPDCQLELLSVKAGGVATSGQDYRRWLQAGEWQHHIIDPRTGKPARTNVVSATVIAPTACVAEIGAKVALLLGDAQGLAWLDARLSLAGMLVLEDGRILRSECLRNYIWSAEHANNTD